MGIEMGDQWLEGCQTETGRKRDTVSGVTYTCWRLKRALHDIYGYYYLDLSDFTTSDCQRLANEAQEKTGADSCVQSSSFAGCFINCYYSGEPDQNSIDQLDRNYC
ncbi:hypothetical protein QL093DRAFT_2486403 [Fusarium oxysporum]|nr:hypothetical protein QL093DRAFT_2486403 [Fusarium oxysporum]